VPQRLLDAAGGQLVPVGGVQGTAEVLVDGGDCAERVGIEGGDVLQAGAGAPRMAGSEPARPTGQAGVRVEAEHDVYLRNGKSAPMQMLAGPGGAGAQQQAAVLEAGRVGERGQPVPVAEHRAAAANRGGVAVLDEPVGLVRVVVVDGGVVGHGDGDPACGGVLADDLATFSGQGGHGGGLAGTGHALQHHQRSERGRCMVRREGLERAHRRSRRTSRG